MRRLLMCPPEFYDIEYEINPWMSIRRRADLLRAKEQWRQLYEVLKDQLGARICRLEPVAGLPDLVFTANAGLVYRGRVILSRFRYPERAREEPYFRAWFAEHGFTPIELPPSLHFEGEGDALFLGERLFCGYGFRSDREAVEAVGQTLGLQTVILELADPYFYHLDTCFCPLTDRLALYYPPAFTAESRRCLEREVPDLIAVTEADARRFACNAVVLGMDVVMNAGCEDLRQALSARGFRSHEVALDEFIKAGGSAKCLVLFLDNGADL